MTTIFNQSHVFARLARIATSDAAGDLPFASVTVYDNGSDIDIQVETLADLLQWAETFAHDLHRTSEDSEFPRFTHEFDSGVGLEVWAHLPLDELGDVPVRES